MRAPDAPQIDPRCAQHGSQGGLGWALDRPQVEPRSTSDGPLVDLQMGPPEAGAGNKDPEGGKNGHGL